MYTNVQAEYSIIGIIIPGLLFTVIINSQFDEGPKGLKLSWNCMNGMSKCDTGNYSFCITSQQLVAPDK